MVFELLEISPPTPAGVHHGGHAAAEGKSVRRYAAGAVAQVGFGFGAVVNVNVDVDQTRSHEQSGSVDYLSGLCGWNVGCYLGDLAGSNGHIQDGIDLIPGINDVSAFDKKIELL